MNIHFGKEYVKFSMLYVNSHLQLNENPMQMQTKVSLLLSFFPVKYYKANKTLELLRNARQMQF